MIRRYSARPSVGGQTVEVGQRFFRVSRTAPVWVVRKVFTPDGHRIPHVVLEKAERPSDQNLIAIDQLLDEDAFRPDRRSQPLSMGAASRLRRRRDDAKQLFFR